MANNDISKLRIDKAATPRPLGSGAKRGVYIALILLCTAALSVLYFRGLFTPALETEVAAVGKLYPAKTFTVLNASGYVVAQRKASVASKATGRLVWLGVEEGSSVRSGQVLARLENDDVLASREHARANLDLSRADVERAQAELSDASTALERENKLLAEGFTTKASYDLASARHQKARAALQGSQAAVKAAEASVRSADVALEYTLIRAPFDAVVLTKNADIGDIVTPLGAAANAKAAVVTIADMGSLVVEADVSESSLGKVKPGQACEVQLDALPEARFRGQVHMIVPTADRSKASVMVKVRLLDHDSRILPEMSAKVSFLERPVRPEEQTPALAVNASAVLKRSDRNIVFLLKDGIAVETTVSTARKLGDMIEITAGLKTGDKVLANPPRNLKTGAKIKTPEK